MDFRLWLIFSAIVAQPILIFFGALMYKYIYKIKNYNYSDEVSHGHMNFFLSFYLIAPFEFIFTGIKIRKTHMIICGIAYFIVFLSSIIGFILMIIK
jgi:hypothetical protein